jgi:hypothetical protein
MVHDNSLKNLQRFQPGVSGNPNGRPRSQLQAVLIVYGYNETGLACQIEPMKIINFGLEDHGFVPHAACGSRRTANLIIH